MKTRLALTACLFLACGAARAAEVSSNGTGGGPWSDPATWRGKAVPGPKDDVVIQKHDVIVFDRDDSRKTSCAKLQIDPKGALLFKTGAGKKVCVVSEGVETFGVIKLDGTRAAADWLELRLTGDKAETRKLKVGRGGGLLLYGKANLPKGRLNVALTCPQLADAKEDVPALVEVGTGAGLDCQRAVIENFKLQAKNLDNTGARANERCNVIGCRFTGPGRVAFEECDSPVIAKNTFEYKGTNQLPEAAIATGACPLVEIKGNTVRGKFLAGISIYRQTDTVLTGNTVEQCGFGVVGGYGLPNLMIKDLTVRGCETGLRLEGSSLGALEGITVEGAKVAFHHQNSNFQLTNFHVKKLDSKGTAILWESGTLKLLNCNVAPAQIKLSPAPNLPPTHPQVPITAQQYALIAVKGAPAGALVEVRTNDPKLAADAADPNVRHSPAPVVNGLTPLPGRVNCLVVKGWSLDLKGKQVPAPEYVVKVLGPAAKEGEARPVLKTVTFRPAPQVHWERPTDSTPTLEVKLK
jgi:parallel beta-helix repeat protein